MDIIALSAIIILFIYLTAIMPRMIGRPDIRILKKKFYAHRGLHKSKKRSPENSMKAFELAIENQYGIELDVQLTKDKIPVIFHDYTLLRVCGVDKRLDELTYEEISKFYLYQSKEKIPKLTDVLAFVDGQVPIIVEIKVKWKAKETCKIVNGILDKYKGVYCIESFSPLALLWYRMHRRDVLRGQLSNNFLAEKEEGSKIQLFLLQNLLLNFLSKPDFIAYNYNYRNNLSFVICTKIMGAKAFAWTIRSEESLEESKQSFQYFIFDRFIPREEL